MKLSIVTSLYNSAATLEEFYRLISTEAAAITPDYEIIMVNDGSPDHSLSIAIRLYEQDSRVKIIDLSRNFGEHKALMTGIAQASGDYIFTIQSDLEVSPTCLKSFWSAITSSPDTDLISGTQERRRGNFYEYVSGHAFYWLFNKLSRFKITMTAGCRMMTRRFANALLLHQEHAFFLAGICSSTGFQQQTLVVEKTRNSKSNYSLARQLLMAVEAITSFSSTPLRFIFYLGSFISFSTLIYILIVLFKQIVWGLAITGWTSLIIAICFFGGLITMSVGLVGIYLSRIFLEVKGRPFTIIRQTYKHD